MLKHILLINNLHKASFALVLLIAGLGVVSAQDNGDTDWSETTRSDLTWAHQQTLENHPGAVDSENPDFVPIAEAALASALQLAASVTDYAGYNATLLHYTAAFRDGHFGVGGTLSNVAVNRWAGIVLAWRESRGFVVARTDAAEERLLGSTLNGCGTTDADTLMLQRVFAFSNGKPDQPAYWMKESSRLLFDNGNPLATPPRLCTFTRGSNSFFTRMNWRPVTNDYADFRRETTGNGLRGLNASIREIEPGYFWVNLPDFSPDDDEIARLRSLFAEIRQRRAEIRNAELLVVDMRSNAGGSSAWGLDFIKALWGDDYIDSLIAADTPSSVDWRVSQTNYDYLESLVEVLNEQGRADLVETWLKPIINGIGRALSSGEDLYREVPQELNAVENQPPTANPVNAEVLLLTHSSCASACLDFADVMLELGATQVGAPTSSDTLYMEVRDEELPSGFGVIYIPMKVYRDRERGNNDYYDPTIRYEGLDWSSAAMESWIGGLRQQR